MQRWQKILAEGYTTATALCEFLEVPVPAGYEQADQSFATRVPKGFALRMQKGNSADPLLLQVLPQGVEMDEQPGFIEDPLVEAQKNPLPGIIHKYHGRILITFAAACAVNCRYCFRRHFPYQDNHRGTSGWAPILEYIANDHSITEVILSGGDPLLVADSHWQNFLERLAQLKHVQTLRIHSRIPVVLPERITPEWLRILAENRLNKVLVIHANHPNELDASVENALQGFKQIGGVLLNQSVLLKGVNDSAPVLVELSHRLFALGILPYYLHLLDKVKGSAHFEVSLEKALRIYTEMHRCLPGYLLPKLAREEAGMPGKTLLTGTGLTT